MGRPNKTVETKTEVQQLRESLGMTRAAFAAAANISVSYIRQLEQGTKKITRNMRTKLQRIRIDHGLVASPCTRDEAEIMQLYRALPADGKATAIDVVRALAGASNTQSPPK